MAVRAGSAKWARLDIAVVESYVESFLRSLATGTASSDETGRRAKKEALEIITGYEPGSPLAAWLGTALQAGRELLDSVEKGLAEAGYYVARLAFALESQGLVGAGSGVFKSVFEVGLTVDPVLGLPYYPGSGLKGAMRSFVESYFGEDFASEVFGWSPRGREDPGREGAVFVSDMLPVGCAKEKCSIYRGLIVNPHYHREGEAVKDELHVMPNPVLHVGIEEGTVFEVVVGVNELYSRSISGPLQVKLQGLGSKVPWASKVLSALSKGNHGYGVLLFASLVLMEALRHGVAARSSKGYNVFKPFNEPPRSFRLQGYRYSAPIQHTVSQPGTGAPRRGGRRQR